MGKYIDTADNKGHYLCTRICVEVDLEVGLPEAVKLKVGTWSRYQKLDYEQLPFKCRLCQEHGHFQRNCPKSQVTVEEEGWQQVKKGKSASKNQGKKPSGDMQNKSIPSSSKSAQEVTQGMIDPPQKDKDPQPESNPQEQPSITINIAESQPEQQSGATPHPAEVLE